MRQRLSAGSSTLAAYLAAIPRLHVSPPAFECTKQAIASNGTSVLRQKDHRM
jgi:hypothetical protein